MTVPKFYMPLKIFHMPYFVFNIPSGTNYKQYETHTVSVNQ